MARIRPKSRTGVTLPRIPVGLPPEVNKWAQDLLRAIEIGLEAEVSTVQVTINPAAVSANTTEEQTFTVLGLDISDRCFVSKPSHTAGVGIVNVRVSAADTLAITFMNPTAVAVNPPSETYAIVITRGD